jgi:hypothetical protein
MIPRTTLDIIIEWKILPLGIKLQFFQPIASHFTNFMIFLFLFYCGSFLLLVLLVVQLSVTYIRSILILIQHSHCYMLCFLLQ